MKTPIVAFALSILISLSARAELKWEQTTLELHPTAADKPDPKTITVKVGKDFTVKHIKVTSSSPDFQAKVEEKGNGEFKIDVQPQETKNLIASTLTIQPEDSQKVFYATARITNSPTVQ